MTAKPRAARVIGRLAVGILGTAVIGAAITATGFAAPPSIQPDAPGMTVEPGAQPQVRACPGGLIAPGGADGTITSLAAPAYTQRSDGPVESGPLPLRDDAFGGAGLWLRSGADAAVASAAAADLDTPEQRGMALLGCAEPRAESWIVAGSLAVGNQGSLRLANPGEVDATVDLAIFGEAGALTVPGGNGIIVPARQQIALPLAALAQGTVLPVIHVTARGTGVVASLQTDIMRGLEPGGLENSSAVAEPSTSLTIPGLLIPEDRAQGDSDEYDDRFAAIRIVAPGGEESEVTVEIRRTGESEPVEVLEHTLPAGATTEFGIAQLPPGNYVASIRSSAAVVAGARVVTGTDPQYDHAWFGAATPLGSGQGVAVPEGIGAAVLSLANPGTDSLDVRLRAESGAVEEITIPAGEQRERAVEPGTGFVIETPQPIVAALSGSAPGRLASMSLGAVGEERVPLTIFPR